MAYTAPYLAMLDTTTQAITVGGTPQLVTFNTTILASKIAVTSSSRFTFNEAGTYQLISNFQLDGSGVGKIHDLWARVNGTDVTNSLSKNTLVNTNDEKDITHVINFTVTAGQYVELWQNGDSTTLSLLAVAAGVTPTRPASNSIHIVIQRKPV